MTINPLKKRKKERAPSHPLLVRMQLQIEARLRRLAAFLQAKTSHYSENKMKTFLYAFCVTFATASGWIAYESFQRKPRSSLHVTPLHFALLANGVLPPHPLPSQELRRIHRFKKYLDSLSASQQGQALRDSLLRGRLHLIDTLNYLETIYDNEQKNETYGKEKPSH